MAPALRDLDVQLVWQPLDLSQLLSRYRRGAPISEQRRDNVRRVARELDVAVEAPPTWPDSRDVNAVSLALEDAARAATWRERIFTALHEERRTPPTASETAAWTRDLGWTLPAAGIERARAALRLQTEEARDAMVTGVPTFMLGPWPVGGIQTQETMLQILGRHAAKVRADGRA